MQLKANILVLFFLLASVVKSQTFSVSFADTIAYGPAVDSTSLSCWNNDFVTNLDSKNIALDVVRVENVTPIGWTSAFCFQSCALPTTDSIRAILGPYEIVNIAFHFQITGIPDSSTALMKFKNVNDPTEVFYQRFYGISVPVSSIVKNDNLNLTKIYPNPINYGSTLNIENQLMEKTDLTILDLSGRIVQTATLNQGLNQIKHLVLDAGTYTYILASLNKISSGKFVVIK